MEGLGRRGVMFWSMVFLGLLCAAALQAQDQAVALKVAAVQFRSAPDVAENLKRIGEKLGDLADAGVNVAVFPEGALTGYSQEAAEKAGAVEIASAEARIGEICRRKGIAAVLGSVYKVNGKIYNTAVVYNSRGELVERYAKMYLAGEKWFTPGNHISLFELEGVPSTVIICHDERYPELARLPAIGGARVLYYISHESGMRQESKLAPYRAQLMARAVENGMIVVSANAPANYDLTGSHGQSRIVASDGNVVREASFFGEDTLIDTVEVNPGKLERPLEGALGDWWLSGVEWMMKNRHNPLE